MSSQSAPTGKLAWLRHWRLWVGVAVSVLVVGALVHFAWIRSTKDPLELVVEGILTNILSTLLGVLVGVPIAVYIALWQLGEQRRNEAAQLESKRREEIQRDEKRRETQARAAAERRNIVIGLLNQELDSNQSTLMVRSQLQVIPLDYINEVVYMATLPATPLSTELWRALAASGGLTDVDPTLLAIVAKAYNHVQLMIELERDYLGVQMLSAGSAQQARSRLNYYGAQAIQWVRDAFNATNRAYAAAQPSPGNPLNVRS